LDLRDTDILDNRHRVGSGHIARLVGGVLLMVLILVACGGSGSNSNDADATAPTTTPVHAPEALPAAGPVQGTLRITAAPDGKMAFAPVDVDAHTGIYRVAIDVGGEGHDFAFLSAQTRFAPLQLGKKGTKSEGRAFFAEPGDYKFACLVPGHAAMHGTVHVNGRRTTLAAALTAARKSSAGTSG
jgi:plastocyanin